MYARAFAATDESDDENHRIHKARVYFFINPFTDFNDARSSIDDLEIECCAHKYLTYYENDKSGRLRAHCMIIANHIVEIQVQQFTHNFGIVR